MIQNVHVCCFDCFVLRRRRFDTTILQRPFGIGFKFLSESNATVIRTGELILFLVEISAESSDRTGCRSSKTGYVRLRTVAARVALIDHITVSARTTRINAACV